MTEGLKFTGRIRIDTLTSDGEIVSTWENKNTGCYAGLNALVGAISYAGVQDIAPDIGSLASPVTPIYGALGGPLGTISPSCVVTSGSTLITASSGTPFLSVQVGWIVSDSSGNIPAGATVSLVDSAGTYVYVDSGHTPTGSGTEIVTFRSPAPRAVTSIVVTGSPIVLPSGTSFVTTQCSTTAGSSTVTAATSGALAGVSAGWKVAHWDIIDGAAYFSYSTTVVSVGGSNTTAVLSTNATTTSTGDYITFYSPTSYPFSGIGTTWGATSIDIPMISTVVSTILAGGITSTSTAITVASATNFPLDGSFDIVIGTENMTVTAGQGTTTWTVVRGVNGTTPAAHSTGAAVVAQVASSTSVAYVSPSGSFVALDAASIGTSTSESVMFSPSATSSNDTTLFSELPAGVGRTTASASASNPGGFNLTPPQFTWQFQFPINYGSDITITEAGVFLLADSDPDTGEMLNHALINPPVTWANTQMLTLSVTIGLSP